MISYTGLGALVFHRRTLIPPITTPAIAPATLLVSLAQLAAGNAPRAGAGNGADTGIGAFQLHQPRRSRWHVALLHHPGILRGWVSPVGLPAQPVVRTATARRGAKPGMWCEP